MKALQNILKASQMMRTDLDIFKQDCITSIHVHYYTPQQPRSFVKGYESARATIEFQKGDMKGEKQITGENIPEVFEQIKEFIEGLEL